MFIVNLILGAGIVIGMLGTLVALALGLFAMSNDSEASRTRSNNFMRYRIGFQFLALVSVALFLAINFTF